MPHLALRHHPGTGAPPGPDTAVPASRGEREAGTRSLNGDSERELRTSAADGKALGREGPGAPSAPGPPRAPRSGPDASRERGCVSVDSVFSVGFAALAAFAVFAQNAASSSSIRDWSTDSASPRWTETSGRTLWAKNFAAAILPW